MNKKIEWALFIDKEGVDYKLVFSRLKERLKYSEILKTMHIHSSFGRIVEFEHVVFSYKVTDLYVKFSFKGEVQNCDDLVPKIVFDSMKDYIALVELDEDNLHEAKRTMMLVVDDNIVTQEEFNHMKEIMNKAVEDNLICVRLFLNSVGIGFLLAVLLLLFLNPNAGGAVFAAFILCAFILVVASMLLKLWRH